MGVNFAPLTSRVASKEWRLHNPGVQRYEEKPSLNHFFLRNNFPLSVPLIRCWLFDSNFREFTVVFCKGKVDSTSRSDQMKH
ncbi:hypothetical protein CDAR_535131 [Caerostris darwini]|uniref:Uncharacterized protein n=1 Tax=Caerostris darwini TaxID=1538125 RepID=A0AAV4QLN6_9ARAC|nr:hypothetical protein CDAR_535131 [Caerostris darwini]